MNLASVIDPHPDDSVALISRGQSTDYGTLRQQVGSVRAGFVDLGLEPDDRIALVIGNNWYFVVSYLAALGAGLVVVPLNPASPSLDLAAQLAVVTPRAVVVGPAARSAFEQVDRSEIPSVSHVIGAGFAPDGGISLTDLLETEPVPVVEREASDPAVLMFTSGTAGAPRAAMLTHGNLYANIRQALLGSADNETPAQMASDVSFGVLPFFHIFGLNVILGISMYAGSSVLLVERFDPVSALESIHKHGVTIVSGPPTLWSAFAAIPGVDPTLFASVRRGTSGAAKLPGEVLHAVANKFGVRLEEGYGLTEASPVVTTSSGFDAPEGSVGVPVPGVELRLVDTDDHDVLVGDVGELWVRGPNVFAGYWQDEEASSRVLDDDGWLRTGDLAVVDDDGFISIVDRAKDLIIVSGFNVFPAEVEEVLLEHPAVASCAVVGIPHPHTGEAIKAYVVARPGLSIEEDDVIDFCASRLPRYKCPNKIWFVDEVPVAMTGKILRRFLREDSAEPTQPGSAQSATSS